jgi:Tol biopolymer transport system component/tRNA A-37 threonylcarbamoyl transferase component Bud32
MIGQTISHYRIQRKLGEGGMGVVYKAEDTKLDRTVALKFLAPHLVPDELLRKRLVREAKSAAALDHPNICTVFEIDEAEGQVFLAMAFVEGRTVKEMIAERPLKLEDALDIVIQTASGIRSAHEKGIVHRDIKPANVMVDRHGQVKVMDFGLAQLTAAALVTQTDLTEAASALGTPAYMSPEQAQGQATDQRADIWALAVMLYEMVAGRLPFGGQNGQAILYAIVHTEPEPVTALRSGLPMELDWLIRKCLAKNPAERYQHVDDLLVDLGTLRKKLDAGVPLGVVAGLPHAADKSRAAMRTAMLFALAIVAAVGITLVAAGVFRRSPETAASRTVKFTFTPERLRRGSDTDIDAEVSVSRDGRHITYVEAAGGQLWVRDIDQEKARPVPGATSVYQAFWSPDDRFIGYAIGSGAGADLVRIPAQGGTPMTICKLAGRFRGATWSANGETIVYCDTTGMYTVPAAGGSPTQIVEHPHIEQPSFLDLPDGRKAFLFQVLEKPLVHEIQYHLAGEQTRHLITSASSSNPYPVYSPTGHIIYVDGVGDSVAIWALPFSLATLKTGGKAFPIAQQGSSPKLSRAGTLVYSDVPSDQLQLVWCDRAGKTLASIGQSRLYTFPALSPDDRKLAVHVREGGLDIWICELDRVVMSRLTFDSTSSRYATWSPSGGEITYSIFRNGSFDILSKPSNGTGDPRVLVSTPAEEGAADWSTDQRFLVYETVSRETRHDLLYRERRTDGSLGEPVVLMQTQFEEGAPKLSPDGKFLAYVSSESGRNEVYVRGFPGGAGKSRVSTNGGTAPRWRRDGKELFYTEQSKLMAVTVTTQPAFSAGTPAFLFEKRALVSFNPQYDVTADGKRFIVRERLVGEQPLAIHVAHNWFEEFRRRQQ